jgi:hypothetical protein
MKQVQKMTIHKGYRTKPSLIFLMYYWAAILRINQITNETNKLYTTGTRGFLVSIFSEPEPVAPVYPGRHGPAEVKTRQSFSNSQ